LLSLSENNYSNLNLEDYCNEFAINFMKVMANKGVTDEIAKRMGYRSYK